ncbi:MAG: carboxypeptidase-like regulatory domain-containing protein [Flavobacteriales bacterium]|nr:carboxypeptidase-like regulatory domain-containing protein [Flavobacteriales bacterium]
MQIKHFILLIITSLSAHFLNAQDLALFKGKILDEENKSIEGATIAVEGEKGGAISDRKGYFSLDVPAGKEIIVSITHLSFQAKQYKFTLEKNEIKNLKVVLKASTYELNPVEIGEEKTRTNSMEKIDPKNIQFIPSATGNFEDIIKTQMGVSSNNELTSQYNVRGGNFDENLVYVNDIQIYRPFLIRSGNQEGLSFINSDLVDDIEFSAGGFSARYGDKMSSVLAVKYKEPEEFAGSFTASLLGGSVHVEGSPKNHRFKFISGIRYHSNQYVLGSLDTDGDYKPQFADVQTYMTYDISEKWQIGFLGNYARNKYNFIPEDRETNFGTIQQALRLTIFFEGQEVTDFETYFGAISNTYRPNEKLKLTLTTSAFRSFETETFDILGQYFIDELERDLSSSNFGDVAFNRGIGSYLNHARNYLDATVLNAQHRGEYLRENGKIEWGATFQHEKIIDQLNEWDLIDSAGYSIPQPKLSPGQKPVYPIELALFNSFRAKNTLSSNRVMGYGLRTFNWDDKKNTAYTFTGGIRVNHWDLNQETVFSPRLNFTIKPDWEKDFLFRISSGVYYQPAFYRELRNFDGALNKQIKAQRSIHYVVAADYNFRAWKRPFKFVGEAYYKKMDNIIPYEIDNVRIRYYATNNAEAYAVGADFKINGEFVKGVDSWINIGVMSVQEDIKDDYYYTYYNDEGAKIIPGFTRNNTVTDSIKTEPGSIPRPTDQRINFSLFFQDYLPSYPSYKLHMTFHYGSGLPFGPPSNERYKDTLRIPAYIRVDIGISKELIGEKTKLSPKNPLRHFKSVWVGLDVFNLLQRNNTLSYLWVTDVTNRQYAVPNFLTSRQVNLKLQVKF